MLPPSQTADVFCCRSFFSAAALSFFKNSTAGIVCFVCLRFFASFVWLISVNSMVFHCSVYQSRFLPNCRVTFRYIVLRIQDSCDVYCSCMQSLWRYYSETTEQHCCIHANHRRKTSFGFIITDDQTKRTYKRNKCTKSKNPLIMMFM